MASPQQKIAPDIEPESLPSPTYLWLVEIIKYGLDACWPRWKKLYFRHIHLRFNRFNFTYVNMPSFTDCEVKIETDPATGKTTKTMKFSWREPMGVYSDPDAARAACQGQEFWPVTRVPFETLNPAETIQTGQLFPGSDQPNRHAKPTLPIFGVHLKDLARLDQSIRKQTEIAGRKA